jgi:hypothetical protein
MPNAAVANRAAASDPDGIPTTLGVRSAAGVAWVGQEGGAPVSSAGAPFSTATEGVFAGMDAADIVCAEPAEADVLGLAPE